MLALSLEGFGSSPAPPLDSHQLFLPLATTSVNSVPGVYPDPIVMPKSKFNNSAPLATAAAALCNSPQQSHSIEFTFPLFSYSYALFCHGQNAKPFTFRRFRTLWQKHRGWRILGQHVAQAASSLRVSAHSAPLRYPFPLYSFQLSTVDCQLSPSPRTSTLPPRIYGIIPPHRGSTRIPIRKRGGFSD
jgi:hypothetical protein